MKCLADTELEIMLILWHAKKPLTSNEVKTALIGKRDWRLSTLMTAMDKLSQKGYINIDRLTRTNLYSAKILESEYTAFEGKLVLQKFFGSSLTRLATNLFEENVLTDDDIYSLERFMDSLKKGR